MKGLILSGHPRSRTLAGFAVLLVLALTVTACSVKEPIQTTPSGTAGLSQKLNPFREVLEKRLRNFRAMMSLSKH